MGSIYAFFCGILTMIMIFEEDPFVTWRDCMVAPYDSVFSDE